jgi:hypothetical protein
MDEECHAFDICEVLISLLLLRGAGLGPVNPESLFSRENKRA